MGLWYQIKPYQSPKLKGLPMMDLWFMDAETFYAKDYTLRKLDPPSYILDQRFELQMMGVKRNHDPAFIVDGPDFPAFLAGLDPSKTAIVTFNALFDMSILSYRYGFVPARSYDAMAMARVLYGHQLKRLSLEAVTEHFGGTGKLDALPRVMGMRREEIIAAGLWSDFQAYCAKDVEDTARNFWRLAQEFPQTEYRIMDLIIRCATQPQFMIDQDMLRGHLAQLAEDKAELLRAASTDADALNSASGFKALLEQRGVEIEYKQGAKGLIPCFAKTDQFMEDLTNHEDELVQALAAARLGVKSTIEETRGERMLNISLLPWPHELGVMPMPYRLAGAHTQRVSGDWKMNMQNLPARIKGSKLRRSLIAPEGETLVTADLGQIEARLTAWLCHQKDLLEQFATGKDPYAILASEIFGFRVDRKVHEIEGHIGKGGVLGLGFRCGADKFYSMVIRNARSAGMDVEKLLKIWTLELSQKSVDTYRKRNAKIRNMWYRLDGILESVWCGRGKASGVKVGPVLITKGAVTGPGGLQMRYANPTYDPATGQKTYTYGAKTHNIHGGYLLENIIQFLARIILMNTALRLDTLGYRFCLQTHDELGFFVPDAQVDTAKKIIYEEMIKVPSWAPGLPLKTSIGSGKSYGEAK